MNTHTIQHLDNIRTYLENIGNYYNVRRVSKFNYNVSDYFIYTIDYAVYMDKISTESDILFIKDEISSYVIKYINDHKDINIEIKSSDVFYSTKKTARINYRIRVLPMNAIDKLFREELKVERNRIQDFIINNMDLKDKILTIDDTEVRIVGFSHPLKGSDPTVIVSSIKEINTYKVEPYVIYESLYKNKDDEINNIMKIL